MRTLGNALGTVLREQSGTALFERVELLRNSAKARRAAQSAAGWDTVPERSGGRPLEAQAAGMAFSEIVPVLKAFTTYFQLVNLA